MPSLALLSYAAVAEAALAANDVEPRIWVMSIIFAISLFAVTFPGLSKQVAFLRIPHILFFIGKHFGTGVILATAFIHLLSDAFESLQKRVVKEEYNNIGKWTGLIILASLLAIFLIEYTSTTYVDLLQAHPSPPSTPSNSRPTSPSRTPPARALSPTAVAAEVSRALQSSKSTAKNIPVAVVPTTSVVNERTPLVRIPSESETATQSSLMPDSGSTSQAQTSLPKLAHVPATTPVGGRPQRARSLPRGGAPYHPYSPHHGHHHHHHPSYMHHHAHPHIPPVAALVPIDILTNSPRLIRTGQGVCICPVPRKEGERGRTRERSDDADVEERSVAEAEEERRIEGRARVGRRRQVIGILVLQLGIMIHSLVIGLTLSIASGADFTSLTTAIIFHQLFEGFSLGIRIAALPSTRTHNHTSSTPSPQTPSSGYGTLPYNGCKPNCNDEYADKKWWHWRRWAGARKTEFNWLKFTLSILFAITTPLGMGIGMLSFKSSGQGRVGMAHMYLVQGIMSAISAGMLIYAATVEMIAGDFVFGDVEGHSHGHGHHDDDDVEEAATEDAESGNKESKIKKKILAVVSLLAGVGGMVLVGLVE